MGDVAHAGAAVFLLDREAEHAQVTHLAPEIGGEVVVAVDGGGARRDLGLGKAADAVAEHVDLLAEIEVEAVSGVAGHGVSLSGRKYVLF